MNTRPDWPLGPALRSRRESQGLSVKAAARRTNKRVSDGRWYQLESGYQQIKGQLIPISTTPATVAAAAEAVSWDVTEALKVAGFDPVDLPEPPASPLADISDEELVAELLDRLTQRHTHGLGGQERGHGYNVGDRIRASLPKNRGAGDSFENTRHLG